MAATLREILGDESALNFLEKYGWPKRSKGRLMAVSDRIGELYVARAGNRPRALPDIIALIISIIIPIIQGCINKGQTKAQVADAMKSQGIRSRVAVRLAMREVGCRDESVYLTIVDAGIAGTEQDVTEFLGENEV